MDHAFCAGHQLIERVVICQITHDPFDLRVIVIRRAPHQRLRRLVALPKNIQHRLPDEAGASGKRQWSFAAHSKTMWSRWTTAARGA